MLVGYINVTMKLYPIKKEHKTRQYVYGWCVLSCSIHHYIENVIINKMLTIVSNYICVPHSVNWSRQFDHRFSTSLCVCVFLCVMITQDFEYFEKCLFDIV